MSQPAVRPSASVDPARATRAWPPCCASLKPASASASRRRCASAAAQWPTTVEGTFRDVELSWPPAWPPTACRRTTSSSSPVHFTKDNGELSQHHARRDTARSRWWGDGAEVSLPPPHAASAMPSFSAVGRIASKKRLASPG